MAGACSWATEASSVTVELAGREARLGVYQRVGADHTASFASAYDTDDLVVVCDHDSRVLARRTFRCRAWDLGIALDSLSSCPTR
jgi:hypothetical protein